MFFTSNKGVITLRADNGSPFKNEEVMTLMESLGIGITWSIPYKSNTNRCVPPWEKVGHSDRISRIEQILVHA